jgi:hypothetical protein
LVSCYNYDFLLFLYRCVLAVPRFCPHLCVYHVISTWRWMESFFYRTKRTSFSIQRETINLILACLIWQISTTRYCQSTDNQTHYWDVAAPILRRNNEHSDRNIMTWLTPLNTYQHWHQFPPSHNLTNPIEICPKRTTGDEHDNSIRDENISAHQPINNGLISAVQKVRVVWLNVTYCGLVMNIWTSWIFSGL